MHRTTLFVSCFLIMLCQFNRVQFDVVNNISDFPEAGKIMYGSCWGSLGNCFCILEYTLTLFRYTDIMKVVIKMNLNIIIKQNGMTKYKVAKLSGVPHATLNDLCSGKSRIEKCSAETLYRIAKALNVSMESLVETVIIEKEEMQRVQIVRERSYEYGLPEYLQYDLDAYKEALRNNSRLLDCFWGELYGSINMAEISDGLITPEHADYLRKKYLWR